MKLSWLTHLLSFASFFSFLHPSLVNHLWHSSDLRIGLFILQRSSALLLLLKSGTESNRIYTALRIGNLLHGTSEYCKPLLFTALLTQDKALHCWTWRYYWGHIAAVKAGRSLEICLPYCSPCTALPLPYYWFLSPSTSISWHYFGPLALSWYYLGTCLATPLQGSTNMMTAWWITRGS